jgi:hypothetical protein
VQQFAGGQCGRHGNAAVDSHHAPITGRGDRVGDVCEREMPAASAVTGDPVGLYRPAPVATGGIAPSDPGTQTRPTTVEPLDLMV